MQCAHGDMLLQLQSVLVTCVAKFNIQKDPRFISTYGIARLEDYELIVIALVQVVPQLVCSYFLFAYMFRIGLHVSVYSSAVKETIGAVILSMLFPMGVFLFFIFG